MEELKTAFSESSPVTKSGGGKTYECDPIGQLIDKIASEYNWTDEYILDQPYPRLKELVNCIDIRRYYTAVNSFREKVLSAGGGSKRDIEQYFEQFEPKSKTQEDQYVVNDVPDLSGFVHIVKE